METKKELLKIYSSYLPYELQFIYSRDIPSEVNAWKLVGLIDRKDSDSDFFAKAIRSDYKNQINTTLSLIKPILYSMDYLTKEIEYKGIKLIPSDWVRKNYNSKYEMDLKILYQFGTYLHLPYVLMQ